MTCPLCGTSNIEVISYEPGDDEATIKCLDCDEVIVTEVEGDEDELNDTP